MLKLSLYLSWFHIYYVYVCLLIGGRVDFDLSFIEFAGVFISQQHNLMIHQSILSPVIRSFEGTEVLIRCFVCCSRLGLRFDGEFEDQSLRIVWMRSCIPPSCWVRLTLHILDCWWFRLRSTGTWSTLVHSHQTHLLRLACHQCLLMTEWIKYGVESSGVDRRTIAPSYTTSTNLSYHNDRLGVVSKQTYVMNREHWSTSCTLPWVCTISAFGKMWDMQIRM